LVVESGNLLLAIYYFLLVIPFFPVIPVQEESDPPIHGDTYRGKEVPGRVSARDFPNSLFTVEVSDRSGNRCLMLRHDKVVVK